jgi:hypothetical protein
MGVRKKPKVARGPKLIIEIRQPHTTITTGVRQPIGEALVAEANETAMAGNPYREFENNCYNKKEATIALPDPVPCRGSPDRNRRDLLERNSSGCLYGLTPPSPNEKFRNLLLPAHGS